MKWNRIRKKARKWLRRNRLILQVSCVMAAVFAVALMIPENAPAAPRTDEYGAFLDALGMRESTDNYAAVNRYGYMGRYQMGGSALEEAGFKNEDGSWTALAHSYGIYSKQDFLSSPTGQNAAIAAYHKKICSYIRYYGLDKYLGTSYCGVTVTRSGLLAACHLVGVGRMKSALASGTHAYDGNRTPAKEYMARFAGFDIAQVWGE